ncbi:hypothetical protein QYE76_037173 [Lolium multiflorum]|uniref:Uncharacterized protein n=1 Tax=Lolium multiflorum TaxID=4521 RepID=A0AAD8VDK6_LOLMU|nr:hypothetical protein QYE76_037173 [Lolium multiflorum]
MDVEGRGCLAEAWMTVSMNGIIGANQSFDTCWLRVKQAYEERKLVDPYFNKTNERVPGDKAMATHWGIMRDGVRQMARRTEERARVPIGGHDLEQKVCSVDLHHRVSSGFGRGEPQRLGCSNIRLPFSDVLRWPDISLQVAERDVANLEAVLDHIAATNLTTIQRNLWDPVKRRALVFNHPMEEGDATWQVLKELEAKLDQS